MKKMFCPPLATLVLLTLACGSPAYAADPKLAHMVYFQLKDSSPAAKEKLVEACQQYLSGHEGAVAFATGVLAEDLQREVNDRDFDVSLHVVFENKAAHDKYQTHPRHLKFIEEQKENWDKVRVFDSYLSASEAAPRTRGEHTSRIPLPAAAASFAGMIVGKVLAKREGQLVVHVERVAQVWKHSHAKEPQSLVGKRVQIDCGESEGIAKFVGAVQVGETAELDVAHKRGETLTILELTAEQRSRAK